MVGFQKRTCCILTETTGIFCILTSWVHAHTYKEYVAKNIPQRDSVLREILHFLPTHHHQQWAGISQNGKAKGCYFHFWKHATVLPLDHKVHITLWFPFLDIWLCKSICEYLNEISTKYCHITTFRKPLTKATQLILISILGNSDQISQQKYWKILIKWRKFVWSWSWLNHDAKHKQSWDNWEILFEMWVGGISKICKNAHKMQKIQMSKVIQDTWYQTRQHCG